MYVEIKVRKIRVILSVATSFFAYLYCRPTLSEYFYNAPGGATGNQYGLLVANIDISIYTTIKQSRTLRLKGKDTI